MKPLPALLEGLIRMLPADFRTRHEEDLRESYAEVIGQRTGAARAIAIARAAWDILRGAAGMRTRGLLPSAAVASASRSSTLPWYETLLRDARFSLRSLHRDRGVVSFVVLVVGLGIGASATVISLANTLLVEPLPFLEPDRLVWISNGDWGPDKGQNLSERSVQVAHVLNLQAESQTLVDVAGYSRFDRAGNHTLTGESHPLRITRLQVTGNFFDMLGVEPLLGRTFSSEEINGDGSAVVMLPHGAWIRLFGADPSIVGQSVGLDGANATVVGVLPASFDFNGILAPDRPVDFIVPFALNEQNNRRGNSLGLIARLSPNATIQAAQSEATAIAARNSSERLNRFDPHLTTLREHISGGTRPVMVLLLSAVGLVMLMVCANLSNLLLSRGAGREQEFAVRTALGAGRSTIIRQLLTESLMLSGAGAALGLLISTQGTRYLAQMDATIPLLSHTRVDAATLSVTLLIAVGAGLTFGVLPAARLSAVSISGALKSGTRSASADARQRRLRGALVISEIALACTLLIGAGLLTRSVTQLLDVDLGFSPDNTIALRVDPVSRFASQAERGAFVDEVLSRANAAPGVDASGIIDVLPMAFNRLWCMKTPLEQPDAEGCDHTGASLAYVRIISDGYVEAMGLSLVGGRELAPTDTRGALSVVLVNEQLAHQLWPDQNPLGKLLRSNGQDWEVVGVLRGMRHLSVDEAPAPEVFFPIRQNGDYNGLHLIARGDGTPADIVDALRSSLVAVDSNLPLSQVTVVKDVVDRSLAPRKLMARLVVGFASFALVLAALGIFGVVSCSVTQRRREIGVRVALGASAASLQRRVLLETIRLTVVGLMVGVALASALGRSMQGLLFEVNAWDPTIFVAVPTLLLAVAAAAGYLPARTASRMDPVDVLRS